MRATPFGVILNYFLSTLPILNDNFNIRLIFTYLLFSPTILLTMISFQSLNITSANVLLSPESCTEGLHSGDCFVLKCNSAKVLFEEFRRSNWSFGVAFVV
jgi:hypothetical protein